MMRDSLNRSARGSRGGERRIRSRGGQLLAISLCLLALLLSPACSKHGGESGSVVARVNGRKILSSEVGVYYRNQTQGHQAPSAEQAQELRLGILDQLIDDEILMQRAGKLGLIATDAEVDAKLKAMKAPFTDAEFHKRLSDRGITLAEFRRDLRRQITVDKVLNKEVTSKIKISDADVSSYYKQHKAEFNLISPQYHLAQILVTTQPLPQVHNLKNDKAQNEAQAVKKVKMLVAKLKGGADFAKLAMDYSEQPDTASSGGDLGFVPENSLKSDKQAYEAIQQLKPGQYTPALPAVDGRTHKLFGFRILKLISKEPAGQRELSDPEVQKLIRDKLRNQREQLLKAAYMESMRCKAKVENYLAEKILKDNGA